MLGRITLSFTITALYITKPTLNWTTAVYTGQYLRPDVNNYDNYTMDQSGDDGGTDTGTYTLIVSLYDANNCRWEGGSSSSPLNLKFTITQCELTKPTLSWTSNVYSPTAQMPDINNYDDFYMELSGNGAQPQKALGTYTLTISLKDATNYKWKNGNSNSLTFTWKITGVSVKKPNISLRVDCDNITSSTRDVSNYISDTDYYYVSGRLGFVNDASYTTANYNVITVSLKDSNAMYWGNDTSDHDDLTFYASVGMPSVYNFSGISNANGLYARETDDDKYQFLGVKCNYFSSCPKFSFYFTNLTVTDVSSTVITHAKYTDDNTGVSKIITPKTTVKGYALYSGKQFLYEMTSWNDTVNNDEKSIDWAYAIIKITLSNNISMWVGAQY